MPAAHPAQFTLFTRWVGEWGQTQSWSGYGGESKNSNFTRYLNQNPLPCSPEPSSYTD